MCFMSIDSVRSKGASSGLTVVVVLQEECTGDDIAELGRCGDAKNTVRVAGPF